MKKLLAPLMVVALVALVEGCARFHTVQTDVSYDGTNALPSRKITTTITASAFFEANSDLVKFRATQTDKTQGASIGSLNQTANSTNLAGIFGAMAEGIVKGMK